MDIDSLRASLRDTDSPVLLHDFGALVQRDRRLTAGLLCYIAEIDERQLWAEHGYSSMFKFCVERSHMSESLASKRIQAARTLRRFPLIGQMVARGELHVTAVCLLSKHLTEDNHREVLARARHCSARQIEKLIAEIQPRPDAPSRVRRAPRRSPGGGPKQRPEASAGSMFDEARAPAELSASAGEAADETSSDTADGTPAAGAKRRRSTRPEPLSPQRYKVTMTIDEAAHDKLVEAQALLSHRVPSDDLATVFEMGLDALLVQLRKQRTGATSRPRPSERRGERQPRKGSRRSRHVPADVRRAVWKRDENQCAYVSPDGHRCTEARWLELHHRVPFARGGEHTVDGLELRCRPHNQYEADRDYGRDFMAGKRRGSRVREAVVPYVRCLTRSDVVDMRQAPRVV